MQITKNLDIAKIFPTDSLNIFNIKLKKCSLSIFKFPEFEINLPTFVIQKTSEKKYFEHESRREPAAFLFYSVSIFLFSIPASGL
jgi:hypothetical protein